MKQDDAYHLDYGSISHSMLSVFCRSPFEYWLTFIQKTMPRKVPTKIMEVGSVVHAVLLERAAVDDLVVQYDADCFQKDGKLHGKNAAAFRAANPDKVCMKVADVCRVIQIVDMVREHELGNLIAGATAHEKAIYWTDPLTGMECRAKPDFVCDLGDRVVCYDLKISGTISPGQFQRTAKMFCYWRQATHYSSGLTDNYGKPVTFRFFVCESQFPFRIHPYWYDDRSREIAYGSWTKSMIDLAQCYETGDWSDKWTNELTIGPWDTGDDLEITGAEEVAEGDVESANAF